LGVLICADSWFQEGYQVLKQKGVKILAVPSFCSINFGWQIPWTGYSGWPTPAQAKADIGILTEGQAWLKYAMVGKAFTVGNMQAGMNVFLKGSYGILGLMEERPLLLAQNHILTINHLAQPQRVYGFNAIWKSYFTV
jgi:hypothetical protein